MRNLFYALFALCVAAPAGAAAFCPTNCGSFCPTQAECDLGWQWASPSRPMVLYPVSLVRFSDGKLSVNQCTLDVIAYPPWSNPRDGQAISACGPGFPSSVSLRVWCDAVKALPLPAECSFQPCFRPTYVGICGLPVAAVPAFVEETLAAAPSWVGNPRQEARLRRVAAWVASVSGK